MERQTVSPPNFAEFWDHLYDQYAPVVYGICLKLGGDEAVASEIFKKAFSGFSSLIECRNSHLSITACLVRHTHKVAIEYLRVKDTKARMEQVFAN
ncbi:MAG: hypothetical protein ABIX01_06030 [Chitinophagaceae bacterium]